VDAQIAQKRWEKKKSEYKIAIEMKRVSKREDYEIKTISLHVFRRPFSIANLHRLGVCLSPYMKQPLLQVTVEQ
jgi:hypothetical protein